ncbi:mannose-1-phosphate guanylyltransferase/mannose-6-phosphate isomerase [Paraburkholderia sp. J11-2]|uniref:mannose-1-phosphate guanylyltransferase/mannose-6-phosphate isomerase n=1 Tax=Paraburkholderia sp. J11-2 TaxID=2805431 RepID=UPI002AB71025|nr:mannose-1-phosphate guanylyltransferase/mannose-6-phosphate isomerase [Paraburkholderia sp. J11-2]
MDIQTRSANATSDEIQPLGNASSITDIAVVPVVLAGGSGTRLWPLSREQFPKQLIDVLGQESLLQTTVQRLLSVPPFRWKVERPIVVCGEDTRFATQAQLRAAGVETHVIVEPCRRETAPALTLAALAALRGKEDAIVVAMPADHAITELQAFYSAIDTAVRYACDGAIVSLGVPPTRPDSGFGYIKTGSALENGARRIEQFVEKPAVATAERYLASGCYWWNSGIFVLRASVWLNALRMLEPSMLDACVSAYNRGTGDDDASFPDAVAFSSAPASSIDYAVMEHLGRTQSLPPGVVVPLDAGWSDLGTWDAVWGALEKDSEGNVASGRVALAETTESLVRSEGRLVACIGVKNLIVVETADAVMVADRSRVQDVKALVEKIRMQQAPEADRHRMVRRPWGYYDSIDQGDRFQVKRIVVTPGGSLSLQLHHHRAEHWIVVRGTARVTRGDEQFLLSENESTYIPLGVTHRLENPGKLPLELIEVQSGAYLGEDDIVRLDDTYGRS